MTSGLGPPCVAVVGSTASGKSAVAMAAARHDVGRRVGVEIVSVDAMQVYRGMDIGTAKPTPAEQSEVRHHLIDLVDPGAEFGVAEFRMPHAMRWTTSPDAGNARCSSRAPACTTGS